MQFLHDPLGRFFPRACPEAGLCRRLPTAVVIIHPITLIRLWIGFVERRQVPDLDTLLVAVGGGGLIGGIASWYAGRIKIIGVELEAAPTLYRALEAGKPVDAEAGGIAADSLAPRRVGDLMFPIAKKYVSGVALVTDDEIREAQEALWRVLRIVAEPGGAAAFAALFSGRYRPEPQERVGVLVCGANTVAVDFNK
jgi:threonine dehydratase